jgi:hypothetical protein
MINWFTACIFVLFATIGNEEVDNDPVVGFFIP